MFGYRVPAPNEAMLISGGKSSKGASPFRVVTGHGAFVMPVFRKVRFLTLSMCEAEVTEVCVTKQAIALTVRAVIAFKVGNDTESIVNAGQRFLSDQDQMSVLTGRIFSGHLRSIIGSMTVEEIITERQKLATEVLDGSAVEMAKIGLSVDAQQQVNDAINLLSQGVTALVLNPIDSKAIIPAVEKANSMGIPVFTLDRGSDGGKVTSFVASDNVALGATAAKWIADQLTKRYGSAKGNVVDLIGLVGTTAATDREKGFSDEIAKYPDIKVVARQEGAFDQEKSLNAMTNILQKYPQIDAVFGANDDNTVGAEKAIDNSGRYKPLGDKDHIMIIGADGTAQALSAIRAGKQDATISQNPIEMSAKALSFIADYSAKKPVPA